MRIALALLVAIPAIAHADGVSFEVTDHGDSVEVIAHNATASNLTVVPVRSRLEVKVDGQPIAARMPSSDATVLFAEFDSHALSVKTRLGYPETKELAKSAKATQIGSDLHLTFPRHPIVTETVAPVVAPAKTEAPKVEPVKVEAPKPAPVVETKPVEKKLDIKEAAAKIEAPKPAAAAVAPAATHPLPPDHEKSFSNNGMFAVGGLVVLGCLYFMKKKKKTDKPESTIDVLATRALGNKAKVMWLSAGGREMLVAVTQQQVRMLGTWGKDDRVALPRAATLGSFKDELAAPPAQNDEEAPAPQVHSSAVSGLLALRARTSTGINMGRAPTSNDIAALPPINDDVATDDEEADLEWAKEILTATGGRR
ncbi:MAG TPA: flagellar biosynthetic protein FliO [Kofleriaceae bacterium]